MSSSCDTSVAGGDPPPRLRLLFVSGVSVGGAPRSTIELAGLLAARGHEVDVVLGDRDRAPRWYQMGVRLAAKIADRAPAAPVRAVLRLPGRRTVRVSSIPVPVHQAP